LANMYCLDAMNFKTCTFRCVKNKTEVPTDTYEPVGISEAVSKRGPNEHLDENISAQWFGSFSFLYIIYL